MKISLLCPTRNRPDFIYEFIVSAITTAKYPKDLEFIFYTDIDDKKSNIFFEQNLEFLQEDFEEKFDSDIQIKRIIGDRIVLSEMWNKCWEKSTANIFFHAGDDIRFRTLDWDEIVLNKFNEISDKIAFIFGDDGFTETLDNGTRFFGTHGFIHRNWTDTIGYFVPPYFSSDYNDTWLNDVSKKINRIYKVKIMTEHLHPVAGKHFFDKTHKERLKRHIKDKVNDLYSSEKMKSLRQDWVNKLQNFIDNYK